MAETQANFEIYLIIAVAIVVMLLMSGAIVLFVVFYQKRMIVEQLKRQALEFEFQQKMMQAELESQESERRRLAADLHDSIGGMLSTIRVGLSTIGRMLPDPQSIDETKQMLDDTISSVRRISRDLMPSTLEKFGFVHAIKELCERFQGTSKIEIQFTEHGQIPPLESQQRELMVFRIVQELLNNAVKHAQASRIDVALHLNGKLRVSVADDGIGFNADEEKNDRQNGKGLGLYNIENRARLLGGVIEFERVKPRGSRITLILPLNDEKAT
jgi:two-component system, NarL family, sensor kinase